MNPLPYNGGPVWALDPATTTGFAAGLPSYTPRLLAVNFRESKADAPEEVFARAVVFMAEALKTGPANPLPGLIAIEQPFPSESFDTSKISLGLHAIFTGIARAKDIPVVVVPIQSWRKYFLGSGRLSGLEAKRMALRQCGQLGWDAGDDHNAAEAAGIWSWAVSQIDPRLARRVEPLFARVQ